MPKPRSHGRKFLPPLNIVIKKLDGRLAARHTAASASAAGRGLAAKTLADKGDTLFAVGISNLGCNHLERVGAHGGELCGIFMRKEKNSNFDGMLVLSLLPMLDDTKDFFAIQAGFLRTYAWDGE